MVTASASKLRPDNRPTTATAAAVGSRHALHRAGETELRVDGVGNLQTTMRHPVRLLEHEVVAAVDAHDAGEA